MSSVITGDGVALHVESTGAGAPVLFIHEFAGDHRSWEPQARYFGRGYRCVTYAARPGSSSRTRTRAAGRSSPRRWRSTRRSVQR